MSTGGSPSLVRPLILIQLYIGSNPIPPSIHADIDQGKIAFLVRKRPQVQILLSAPYMPLELVWSFQHESEELENLVRFQEAAPYIYHRSLMERQRSSKASYGGSNPSGGASQW